MDDKNTNPIPNQGYPNGDLFHYDIGPDQPTEAADDADYDADGDSDEPFAVDEKVTDSHWPSNAIDPNEPLDEQLPNMPGDPVYQTPTLNPNPIVDVPANSDEKLYV